MVQLPKFRDLALLVCALAIPRALHSSVSVTVSSAAPAVLQDQFLADATAQYDGILTKSASANVWTFKISGRKPAANTVCTDNFYDGFAFGIEDERRRDLRTLGAYRVDCSTPIDQIYQQWFSTPTVMP